MLLSPGVAPGNDATTAKVRAVLERPNPSGWPAPEDWLPPADQRTWTLDRDVAARVLRDMKRGSASDIWGWSVEVLQVCLNCSTSFGAIYQVASDLASGRAPPLLYEALDTARITPLRKSAEKIRPLTSCAVWRRWAFAALVQQEGQALRAASGDSQYAIGRRGGLEAMTLAIRQALRQRQDHTLIQLDCSAAFNLLDREQALQAFATSAPRLKAAVACWLCRPSVGLLARDDGGMEEFASDTGTPQGCPLSPAIFAATVRPALDEILTQVRQTAPTSNLWSYLDDITMLVPVGAEDVALAAAEEALRKRGLVINRSKTLIWARGDTTRMSPMTAQLWQQQGPVHGIVICGSPIGKAGAGDQLADSASLVPTGDADFEAAFLDSHRSRLETFLRAVVTLPTMVSPGTPGRQAALALLRYCGATKVAHLLRMVPMSRTREWAAACDSLVLDAFASIVGAPPLDPVRSIQVGLPTSMGGIGLGCLADTVEAARLGALLSVISPDAGADTRPDQSTRDELSSATVELDRRHQVDATAELGG
jgi:hypothetical protein